MRIRTATSLIILGSLPMAWADESTVLMLNTRPLHLGAPAAREWQEYADRIPDAQRLDLRFTSATNEQEATLFIRQDDVRQDWPVELNGNRVGKLFLMEANLVHAIKIPAGALREGGNLLSILPPKANDDIFLHEIWLDARSPRAAMHQATLDIRVRDAVDSNSLPCRITVVDAQGSLPSLVAPTNGPFVAVRPGVVYTGDGQAQLGLPAGHYTIYASRGFEWSVATQHVHLATGQVARLVLLLRHEVPTPGLVSCDTHVHTFTYSRHGDATMEERMLTVAGEGLELPIATDHNLHVDYSAPARQAGVAKWFTPVTGNEVTTAAGHFNVFPVQPDARVPDFRITDWPILMESIRATPQAPVVVLNHPRNVHNSFQPFAATNFNAVTGENKRGPEFTFDAMELMNSSAQQTDYLLVYGDWFALLNYGYRTVGVGSSDSHDVSRYIVGQGRTYISCPDENPAQLDVAIACSNLLAGRAFVSMGLLVQMTVDERFTAGGLATGLHDQVRIRVNVLGPSWVQATNVALFANGVKIGETNLFREGRAGFSSGEQGAVTWIIPRPPHDVHLVALATGPGVRAPFWAIPRPYQPTSPHWEGRIIGSTNPIWLDADGNGEFTPARGYARRLLSRYINDPSGLSAALRTFDQAVATHVASLGGGAL